MKIYLAVAACLIIMIVSCRHDRAGSGDNFKTVYLEDLKPENLPEGMEFRGSLLYAKEGYKLVPSKDGSEVILMQISTGTGSTKSGCSCDSTGICAPRKDIFGCVNQTCSNCRTVLRIFDQPFQVIQ